MLSKIRIILALALFISAIGARADDGKNFSKQMNELKRSGDYVYAESSAPNEADAKEACDALLKIEITKYLVSLNQSSDKGRIVKNITDYNREYLVQPRGDLIRVFGYISKNSISKNSSAPQKKGNREKESASTKEKTGTTPTVNEKSKKSNTGATGKSQPTAERATPVTPTKSADTTTKDRKSDQQSTNTTPQDSDTQLKTDGIELAKWQLEMLESIVKEPDMTEAKKTLNRYKYQNRIKRLGDRNVTNPRLSDSFYLIFDNSNKPIALLAPSATSDHYDMISGSKVNLDTYSGNQYFWFQISK